MSEDLKEKEEKVVTKAKVQPKIVITDADVNADDRARIIREHQKENPDYVYSWELGAKVQKEGAGRYKEVVSKVEHGTDVLTRMHKSTFEQMRTIESNRSFKATAKQRLGSEEEYKTGDLRRKANPVKVE